MEFLTWHYSHGINFFLRSWKSNFDWVSHYFSLGLLVRTLFSPWKRLTVEDRKPGFNFSRSFENFMFNLISRGIGAVVRFTLFWAGIFMMILTLISGVGGFLLWVLIPPLGLPVYTKQKNQPKNIIRSLVSLMKAKDGNDIEEIFNSEPGEFVLSHLGIAKTVMVENCKFKDSSFMTHTPVSFSALIKELLQKNAWESDFFRKNGIEAMDVFWAALMWDVKKTEETKIDDGQLGRAGLALELLYGYTPNLNQYSVNLSAPQSFETHLIGRDEVVSRMERVLSSGGSVILTGQPGVGKKTVVLEFAYKAAVGEFGPRMSYKRVLEFDYNHFLSESHDINYKKSKLSEILFEASAAGDVILMIRDIHRLISSDIEGYDFTDIFEEYMEKKRLNIIAISTSMDYERFIAPNMRLRKFLEKVEVKPPTKAEAQTILMEAAIRWEKKSRLTIQVNSLRQILDESDRYITETPFPEKALELLDSVVEYSLQKRSPTVTISDVNAVLAEKTGISFNKLTEEDEKKLGNLEEIIHSRLVDQEVAVKLIAKSLRSKTIGLAKDNRPIGSFLFLGPTGVGKTETAKVLARVYYGSEDNIIRFDMAEYVGGEGFERLVGSVSKNRPGVLTTSIKNRPASLLLLDEIEKATPEIFNLFLTILDEGSMTDAFGKKINGRHLFIIGTSNAGAEYIRKLVTDGVKGEKLQEKVINHVLEKGIFTPEFLNRFDGVVVYEPLGKEELNKIAFFMLGEFATNLRSKGIRLEITDEACKKLAEDGYDPAFGARPMRRIINLVLGDLVGRALINKEVVEGDAIKLIPGTKKDEYSIVKI